jgi:hypothetical protein
MGDGERAEVGALNAQDHAKRQDEDVIFLEGLIPRGDAKEGIGLVIFGKGLDRSDVGAAHLIMPNLPARREPPVNRPYQTPR